MTKIAKVQRKIEKTKKNGIIFQKDYPTLVFISSLATSYHPFLVLP